jgi:DNA-binding SARP family transcriptional activator/class 3 adenylate cyclase
MEFRVLGPLEVESGQGLVQITAEKERAVLALLLFRANRTVSRDLLIDELWGEHPPATARHTLEGYVSRLRRALSAGGDRRLIESQPGGYRIRVDEDQLDVLRFERLLEEGRAALASGTLEEAENILATALALWRGPVLDDLAYESFVEAEARRLEELRLGALEARLQAGLQRGRHSELIGELQSLVTDHPLRERLRGQLMLALYRSGRQADALAVYRDGRVRLVDELGIEPGRELQELEQAILRHDPGLELPTPSTQAPPAPAVEPGITPPPVAAEERRKIVTALSCDVMPTATPGQHRDPELLTTLLPSLFERTKAIVEFHGGAMEKLAGDAVMAVFGVPTLHEDDALRACRAAREMQQALPELDLRASIGINSGEALTGTAERLAIGDAVNLAARLQQAADPGEVLIGKTTLELAGDTVQAEPIEPLTLKDRTEPVSVYRLVSIQVMGAPGRVEPRFVGREPELALLGEAWERVLAEKRCELLTIVGEAGMGKSRLVAEALAALDVHAVQARCLPYGNGITYWPVVEVVQQLRTRPVDTAAAAAIASLLGESDTAASAEEIAWAFRKLLEQEAPLVVVFDDIHRGEETFLDLLEGVALLSRGATLLVVCMARPELLVKRPEWPVATRLDPLTGEQVKELVGERVAEEIRERVARAAAGNPLFVVEMLAIAEETDTVEVPPTLQALLGARLDQLDEPERCVLEHAAVEGELFHRGAVQALTPDEPQLTHRLATLTRRGLIHPDKAQIAGEDGFRFSHLLIRDAAYDALPKTTRTLRHQWFADWLEQRGQALVELDEIAGYHLEQAAYYLQELGTPDHELAERAGDRLAAAGRRALWRGDYRTAITLLERALELTRPSRLDVHLEVDLADAFGWPAPLRAVAVADAAAAGAHEAGDEPGEALARVVAADYRYRARAETGLDELEARARAALPLLEQANDHAGLVHVWYALGFIVAHARCRYDDAAEAIEQALQHARVAGQRRTDPLGISTLLLEGPRPAGKALEQIDQLLSERPSPALLLDRAELLAMLGRFDEARAIAREASAQAGEFGRCQTGDNTLAGIAILAGDHEIAAEHLRRSCDELAEQGNRGYLSSYAPLCGRELCALGKYDEAERLARLGRDLGGPDNASGQMLWRQVQALVHAHRCEYAEAERLAREAVEIGERTDALNLQGYTLCDLAEVLEAAGRPSEAAESLEHALVRYERKQNLAMVAQVRPRLHGLRAALRAPGPMTIS